MIKAAASQFQPLWNRAINIVFICILLIMAGVISYTLLTHQKTSFSSGMVMISQETLERLYGLRIELVSVTAGGGLVDVRLKFTDPAKAKSLLTDKNNFPALRVASSGIKLEAPGDVKAQNIAFDTTLGMFLLYPNSGGAVSSGTPVNLILGDIQVEAVPAQ